MEIVRPLDVKVKAGNVLASIEGLEGALPLNESLKELVDTYSSEGFNHYRESFYKLIGLEKGSRAGHTENTHFLGNNIFYHTIVHVGGAIDEIRQIQVKLRNNYDLTETQKLNLTLLVGLSVYTGLEAMAAHEEALNHTYQH